MGIRFRRRVDLKGALMTGLDKRRGQGAEGLLIAWTTKFKVKSTFAITITYLLFFLNLPYFDFTNLLGLYSNEISFKCLGQIGASDTGKDV